MNDIFLEVKNLMKIRDKDLNIYIDFRMFNPMIHHTIEEVKTGLFIGPWTERLQWMYLMTLNL